MADLYEMQAEIYADTRPKYPKEWFALLAALTPHHVVAWDAGTGNGQLKRGPDGLVALLGGEDSVDLVTIATAVHCFDLEKFYRWWSEPSGSPAGVVGVWSYREMSVSPSFDALVQESHFPLRQRRRGRRR
ncbi:unnamed protein product [Spirodela intermedia]|uniref:Methyltransferase n=1 Tax=Spirodela intermedia TaxID=51605 RepID=A0ABN7EAN1_SPIIN|nr:unnamed protein product [Spirodela intermedia]